MSVWTQVSLHLLCDSLLIGRGNWEWVIVQNRCGPAAGTWKHLEIASMLFQAAEGSAKRQSTHISFCPSVLCG